MINIKKDGEVKATFKTWSDMYDFFYWQTACMYLTQRESAELDQAERDSDELHKMFEQVFSRNGYELEDL